MKNIFLTGEKGVGKTTIINKILDELNLDVGGYFTTRKFTKNGIIFHMNDFITKQEFIFADFTNKENKIVKKDTFESFGVAVLQNALKQKNIIVLDELGNMEESFDNFKNSVYEVLQSNKLTLGILKKCESNFIDSIKNRNDTIVLNITLDNRNDKFYEIKKLVEHVC